MSVYFRYDYHFQLVLMALIIIGGIGFPIIFNPYRYVREVGRNRLRQLAHQEGYKHTTRVISSHIIEATVPERYVGVTIEEANLRRKYSVNVLTIIRMKEARNMPPSGCSRPEPFLRKGISWCCSAR